MKARRPLNAGESQDARGHGLLKGARLGRTVERTRASDSALDATSLNKTGAGSSHSMSPAASWMVGALLANNQTKQKKS